VDSSLHAVIVIELSAVVEEIVSRPGYNGKLRKNSIEHRV